MQAACGWRVEGVVGGVGRGFACSLISEERGRGRGEGGAAASRCCRMLQVWTDESTQAHNVRAHSCLFSDCLIINQQQAGKARSLVADKVSQSLARLDDDPRWTPMLHCALMSTLTLSAPFCFVIPESAKTESVIMEKPSITD